MREEVRAVDHPGDFLRQVLADNASPTIEGMPPLTGGLVGYFSFEYLRYAEPTLRRDDDACSAREAEQDAGHEPSCRALPDDFRDMDLMLFDQIIAFDHDRQRLVVTAGVHVDPTEPTTPDPAESADAAPASDPLALAYERARASIERIVELLEGGSKAYFPRLRLTGELRPRFDEAAFSELVATAKRHIHEGDVFQVVLSNPLTAPAEGSLLDAYRVLRVSNPSPYMVYFSSDDVEIAGASPETLARLDEGVLRTFPLAGTRPRGATKADDEALERELLADEKELAEHTMLVDLGRNDLGRVCELGSVRVTDYRSIRRFSKVMHIGSVVEGRIRPDRDAVDAVDAILPAGTLSGAPKLRACQIIAELEGQRRGIYGGALGYLDFAGNMDTCIGIRLAYKKNGRVCVQSGAGIVADSVPAREYQECLNKAAAVVAALKTAQGGVR